MSKILVIGSTGNGGTRRLWSSMASPRERDTRCCSMLRYGTDLAYIHDTGFGEFARSAAPAILDILRRAGISSGLVVDLGCGSGIWARQLTRAGFQVFGVDISPDMIRLAKKNAPRARFAVASLLDLEIPPCVAVTAIGECVNYAFDPANGLRRLRRLFRRVFSALQSGGVFVFDVAGPGRVGKSSQRRFVEGDGWAVLSIAEEDAKRRTLTRRITTFRRIGKLYRRSEEIHKLNLYKPAELTAVLRAVGFNVRTETRYGEFELPQGHAVIVAQRPLG
jgi:SAM-dependent methyltransferase